MDFNPLAVLPFSEGEHVTAMTCWKPHGVELVILATSQNRIFALRLLDKVEVAGPLEFVPEPADVSRPPLPLASMSESIRPIGEPLVIRKFSKPGMV